MNSPKKKSLKRKPVEIIPDRIEVNLENDYINKRVKVENGENSEIDPEFESGNLKYKSKKILYAPRKATNETHQIYKVQSLVNNCIQVLSNHIHQVDHVGTLPFEIFAKALTNASVVDLARIHKYNPQFDKDIQPFWIKQANKDFPLVNFSKMMKENPKAKPSDLYKKLKRESENKLESFINKTSDKVKASRDAQRKTLTVDVIAPRNSHRKSNSFNSRNTSSRSISGRSHPNSSASSSNQLFIPKNMSHPDGTRGLMASSAYRPGLTSRPKQSSDLLAKLRKKYC